jgi:DNA recombination protein RmuC
MSVDTIFLVIFIVALLSVFGLALVVIRGRGARDRAALEIALAELRAALARRIEEVQRLEEEQNGLRTANGTLLERASAAETQTAERQRQIASLLAERDDFAGKYAGLQEESSALKSEVAELRRDLAHEKAQAAEKLTLLENAREQLSNQFKALANEILEEKSKRFTEQNQTNLGQLLEPLKTQLVPSRQRSKMFRRKILRAGANSKLILKTCKSSTISFHRMPPTW